MDLSTKYLGLTLRNPLVASPSPMSQTVDGVRRMADGGVGAVVLYSLFEEQLLRESERDARLADAGADSFGEALSYFPEEVYRRNPIRAPTLSEPAGAGGERGRCSGTRQPQRRHARRLVAVRKGHAGRRRRRDRVEHLLPARGSAHHRAGGRAAASRRARLGQAVGDRAGGGQAEPVFQCHGEMACGWTTPVQTGWCCSTGSCNRTSTRRR